jgi:regulator of protease activity HflC (stomatin/prohibitin superfamily)
MIEYILAIITTLILGLSLNSSVRIINESDEAIVERLGQYNRTLKSGLRLVIPVIEKIVYYDTVRERMLDIPPQDVLTEESIPLKMMPPFIGKLKIYINFITMLKKLMS